MRTGSQSGFTLIELIVTVTIAIILLSMAVPSVMGTLKSNRLIAESNKMIQALHLARSHAIRSGSATVCASSDNKTCLIGASTGPVGYILLDSKQNVVRVYDAPAAAVSIQSDFIGVQFGNLGNATPIAGATTPTSTEFVVKISSCDPAATVDEANVRQVVVLVSGKMVTQRLTCNGVLLS